jgi:hypothetical protein
MKTEKGEGEPTQLHRHRSGVIRMKLKGCNLAKYSPYIASRRNQVCKERAILEECNPASRMLEIDGSYVHNLLSAC